MLVFQGRSKNRHQVISLPDILDLLIHPDPTKHFSCFAIQRPGVALFRTMPMSVNVNPASVAIEPGDQLGDPRVSMLIA